MWIGCLGTSHSSLILLKGWSHTKPRLHLPLWPYSTKAEPRGRGRASSRDHHLLFSLGSDYVGYHHPVQCQLDNWGLNSGKFKRQLRIGLILVKTLGTLALDDQGHPQ